MSQNKQLSEAEEAVRQIKENAISRTLFTIQQDPDTGKWHVVLSFEPICRKEAHDTEDEARVQLEYLVGQVLLASPQSHILDSNVPGHRKQ